MKDYRKHCQGTPLHSRAKHRGHPTSNLKWTCDRNFSYGIYSQDAPLRHCDRDQLQVELATGVACILNVSAVVMGVLVLAVGTSVPDAIGSMIAAKNGEAAVGVYAYTAAFSLQIRSKDTFTIVRQARAKASDRSYKTTVVPGNFAGSLFVHVILGRTQSRVYLL